MKNLMKLSLALALTTGVVSTSAQAQSASAGIQANATILAALTATGVQDLDWGIVLYSTTNTLLASDAASGHFTVQGAPSAGVDVDFVFPATITNGTDNLTVNNWTGLQGINTTRGASAVFDPNTTTSLTLGGVATDVLNLYLGGDVTSAGGESAGLYTGNITMNVAYNGS